MPKTIVEWFFLCLFVLWLVAVAAIVYTIGHFVVKFW
jgi:hypothetical protein